MKLQIPPKPSIVEKINQLINNLEDKPRKMLLGGLILFFVLAASTTLLLAYYVYEPEITSLFQKATPELNPTASSQSLIPTQASIPTQATACAGASLQLGNTSWNIEPIQLTTDGSVDVPADTPGVAYWIKDLKLNAVFVLSPSQVNRDSLSALQGGEEALITWGNCNSATYTLFAPETGVPEADVLSEQSAIGLIVYVPDRSLTSGIMVRGGLASETITAPPTPESSSNEVNAEISLLQTSISKDQKTIQVVISITNYGSTPITLTESDIALTPEGAAPLLLIQVDPILPQKIKPAENKTFTLVFPRPDTTTATLKIYTIEYDLDNY